MLSNSKMYPEFLTLFSNEKMVYFLFLGSFLVLFFYYWEKKQAKKDSVLQMYWQKKSVWL